MPSPSPRFGTRAEFEQKVWEHLTEGPNYAYHPAIGRYVWIVKKRARPKTSDQPNGECAWPPEMSEVACRHNGQWDSAEGYYYFPTCGSCTRAFAELQERFPEANFWAAHNLLGRHLEPPLSPEGQSSGS